MKTFKKCLLLVVLIIAAISSYSYGVSAGILAFVVLGMTLELIFWLQLFKKKKTILK